MINQTHRFHGHSSLNNLHRRGAVYRVQGLNLKYFPSNTTETFRAAVIVSKKVHKSAVVRNRIRRRVYEIIRLNVPAQTKGDIAIQVFDVAYKDMPALAVQKNVTDLLAKAKLV